MLGQPGAHDVARPDRACGEVPADQGSPLGHAGDAVAHDGRAHDGGAAGARRLGRDQGARDRQVEAVGGPAEVHGDLLVAIGVPQRVGQRLLHDPVDGQLLARAERQRSSTGVAADDQPRSSQLLDQPVEVDEGGLRSVVLRVAQLGEQHPDVGEGLARGGGDRREGGIHGGRILRAEVARPVGLRDHDRQGVGDHIMHVPCDPHPLLLGRDLFGGDHDGPPVLARLTPAPGQQTRGPGQQERGGRPDEDDRR